MGQRSGTTDLVIDLGLSSMKLRCGGRGLEIPIPRRPNGQISPDDRQAICQAIRQFLADGRKPGLGLSLPGRSRGSRKRRRAVCGIPARGVSLRSLTLPPGSRDETERLVSFQIEREFPLPLDELAYGYRSSVDLNGNAPTNGQQAVLVAALRRAGLEEYRTLFAECGLTVSFALGTLAASQVCSVGSGHVCVLDIGRTHSQLVDLVDGRPEAVRCLSWCGETVTSAIAKRLGVDRDRAEQLKLHSGESSETPPDHSEGPSDTARLVEVLESAAFDLAAQLREGWRSSSSSPSELILIGGGSRLSRLPEMIERGLNGTVLCRRIEPKPGVAVSAVTRGLERQLHAGNGTTLLRLDAAKTVDAKETRTTGPLTVAGWAFVTALLALASVGLRFVTPLLEEGGLDTRLEERQRQLAAQPSVDSELEFLKTVKSSQSPYLEVLATVAGSAPAGSFVSEVSLNRLGDVSLRGRIKDVGQLEQFRKKLSISGWFTRVVVQERTPQKKHLDFRIMAQFRAEKRKSSPATPPGEESSKPDTPASKSKPPSAPDSASKPSTPTSPSAEQSTDGKAGTESGRVQAEKAGSEKPEGEAPPSSPSKAGEDSKTEASIDATKQAATSGSSASEIETKTSAASGTTPAPETAAVPLESPQ